MFVPPGTNISCTQERGDKHFSHTGGRGGQTFLFEVGGAFDDVDEEMVLSVANFYVSEAKIFVSEASKLSAGARIFKGPLGPAIIVEYISRDF